MLSVTHNTKDAINRVSRHERVAVHVATARAINRALIPARAEAARKIRERTGVLIKLSKASMTFNKAYKGRVRGEIIARGRPIGVIDMPGMRATNQGITYKGKGGRKQLIRGAFIATMSTGHVGAFVRKTSSRKDPKSKRGKKRRVQHGKNKRKLYYPQLKIVKKTVISVPATMIQSEIAAAMDKVAYDAFIKRFPHEMDRELRRFRIKSNVK